MTPRRRRTWEEIEAQEERDYEIYGQIIGCLPSHLAEMSWEKTVKLNRIPYSLKWVLLYAYARNRGIACITTAANYANRESWCPPWCRREVQALVQDRKLMALDAKYWLKQHKQRQLVDA